MSRLQTLCDDGTRMTHTYSKALERWETTVTPPSDRRDQRRPHPPGRPWEGRGR
jgi:hypothetical protein